MIGTPDARLHARLHLSGLKSKDLDIRLARVEQAKRTISGRSVKVVLFT